MLRENFVAITNHLPEPHFLLTQHGEILSVNQAARKKFNIADDMLKDLNLNTLLTDKPDKTKQLLLMWARSKSLLPGKVTFKMADGTATHYLCKGNLIQTALDNQPALILMSCSDKQQSTSVFVTLNEKVELLKREIIERRNAEDEISRLNKVLEQKVKDRTAALLDANNELNRSLEELKSAQEHLVRTERLASLGSMVAGVAHEINTPVGVCMTASSYLIEQTTHYQDLYQKNSLTRLDFESLLDIASESSSIMIANLGRAADLVRSFKQLAVDQTSDEYRLINMKSYLEELLISLRPHFHRTSHSIKLQCPDDIEIESQPGTIAQIINNLIGNSIKHGFEGVVKGLVNIEISRKEKYILLHYSDNGNGISDENLKQIFDPFFTTKRNQGGSGLGMNIVYNLVINKLRGEINATSKNCQGVDFYIKFPA